MCFFILLLAGVFLGLMVSMNGELASYLNLYEISFIVHISGVILLLAYMKFIKKEKLRLNGAPSYVYIVGFLGVSLVVGGSLCAENIGATVTMALSVCGQIIMSALIDHFGWFRTPVLRFNPRRLPGYCIILTGLLIMIYS